MQTLRSQRSFALPPRCVNKHGSMAGLQGYRLYSAGYIVQMIGRKRQFVDTTLKQSKAHDRFDASPRSRHDYRRRPQLVLDQTGGAWREEGERTHPEYWLGRTPHKGLNLTPSRLDAAQSSRHARPL